MDIIFCKLVKAQKHGFNLLQACKSSKKHAFNFLQA